MIPRFGAPDGTTQAVAKNRRPKVLVLDGGIITPMRTSK